MDIEEIREEKREIEKIIHRLLIDFSAKTGLTVEGIYFDKMERMGFKEIIYGSIILEIKI